MVAKTALRIDKNSFGRRARARDHRQQISAGSSREAIT
jgi:hypothetical protein